MRWLSRPWSVRDTTRQRSQLPVAAVQRANLISLGRCSRIEILRSCRRRIPFVINTKTIFVVCLDRPLPSNCDVERSRMAHSAPPAITEGKRTRKSFEKRPPSLPIEIAKVVFKYSSLSDQLKLAAVSKSMLQEFTAFRNSLNHFDPRDVEDELNAFGGLYCPSWPWCEFVIDLLLDSEIGLVKSVDLSMMKEKVISKLYDVIAIKRAEPNCNPLITELFSNVTRIDLPECVDWSDIEALASMSPALAEMTISSANVEYLYESNPIFRGFNTLDDVIEHVQIDPWEFTNLQLFEEKMQRRRLDPTPFTRFVVYMRAGFPQLRNIRIVYNSEK